MATSLLMFLAAVAISISISAMEIALGLLLILFAKYLYNNHIDLTRDCPYFIPFFIYWLATLIPFFTGSEYSEIKGVFRLWNLLYLFVGYYFIRSSNVRLVFAGLAIGGVILATSSVYDVVMHGYYRGYGLFNSYMSTGNMLALSAIMTLGIVITGFEKRFFALAYFCAFLIMVTGIYYTSTRGALLAFLTAACLMLLFKFRLKGFVAAVVMLGVASIGVYFSHIGDRFGELFQGFASMDTSQGWRFVLWGQAWELIKEYPIFGVGYGAFKPMIKLVLPSTTLPMQHPHNAYINQIVLYGVVGFGAFCWLYGKMFYDLLKKMFQNNYAFIGVFVMLTFFLEGITENNFTDGEVKMFQMFFVGCVLGAIRWGLKDTGEENKINILKKI